MKAPFEKFRVEVDNTLIILKVIPHPGKEENAWEIARWVEDAIREKLARAPDLENPGRIAD